MITLDLKTIDGELAIRMHEALVNLTQTQPEVAQDILRCVGELGMLLALATDESRAGGDHEIVHLAASLVEKQTEKLRDLARQLYKESCDRAS